MLIELEHTRRDRKKNERRVNEKKRGKRIAITIDRVMLNIYGDIEARDAFPADAPQICCGASARV